MISKKIINGLLYAVYELSSVTFNVKSVITQKERLQYVSFTEEARRIKGVLVVV